MILRYSSNNIEPFFGIIFFKDIKNIVFLSYWAKNIKRVKVSCIRNSLIPILDFKYNIVLI